MRILDNESLELYLGLYLIGIVGMVVSIIFPIFELVYALYFFAATGYLLFVDQVPEEDPERSSVTHYNRNSSYNWFNYAVGAFIAVSAFLFLFSPINKPLTIFIIWTAAIYFVYRFRDRIVATISEELVEDYLIQQYPEVDPERIDQAVAAMDSNPEIQTSELTKILGISPKKANAIRYSYNIYKENQGMNIYQQQILENYRNPYHGQKPDSFTHTFELKNLSCGDEIQVFLTIEENIVETVHFEARGCAISIASASLLAQSLEGKTLNEVREMSEEELYEILGLELTPNRQKCALLSLQAIQKATVS